MAAVRPQSAVIDGWGRELPGVRGGSNVHTTANMHTPVDRACDRRDDAAGPGGYHRRPMTHSDLLRDPARLWQRVREGQATAILGRLPDPPPDLHLLRVSCEVAPAALRPLLEARRLTEAVLGDARPRPERAKSVRRRTLFGDTPERATEAVVVELWNLLAKQAGARWVVVFDAVEQADDATLAALTQIVKRPGWMQLPLLLVFHGEAKGAAAELFEAVGGPGGAAAVRGEEPPSGDAAAIQWRTLPAEVLRVLRAGALIGPGFEVRVVADLLALEPLAVLETLQQATDLGVPLEDRGEGRFSLPTSALTALSTSLMPSLAQAWHRRLGRLLAARAGEEAAARPQPPLPPIPRRERIARPAEIVDLSAEIIDLSAEPEEIAGEAASSESGVFAPDAAGELSAGTGAGELSAGTGASDLSAGTGGAGELSAGTGGAGELSAGTGASDLSAGTGAGGAAPGAAAGPGAAASASEPPRAAASPTGAGPLRRRTMIAAPISADDVGPAGAGSRRTPTIAAAESAGADAGEPVVRAPRRKTMFAAPAPAAPDPIGWGAPSRVARLDDPLVDEARAAEHLRLAGEFDAAAQHLCEAARKAADMGSPQTAVQHADSALALLATLPPSPLRRQLRVLARIELGRVQWQSAGYDLGFTLTQARSTLEAARADLDADAPVDLASELAQTLAGVCFDLGDPGSLERALAELAAASEMLAEAGDATGAACLLNDQAAVLVRMGSPGRALQLLRDSRRAFDARAHDDPVAMRELAETEHLFARLPLHAQLRPGREQEGYAMGLDHARAAERGYHELGEARELGRVWETMGRLELRRGELEAARKRLEAAGEVQTQLGDLTGLAHTTEALSEVLSQCGRDAEAVTLLRDSVVFNRDKGSPLGLMLNRRAFTALAERLAGKPEHADGLQEVAILLTAGERELGALQPPGPR